MLNTFTYSLRIPYMCAMHFDHTSVSSSSQDHHYVCLAYPYKKPIEPN